jgi:pantothenate kinase type III
MKDTYLLSDIGNTSYDFGLYFDGIEKTIKISLGDTKQLNDFIGSIRTDIKYCMISSVNHHGLENLLNTLDSQSIPHGEVTPGIMDDFCKKKGYDVENTSYLGSDLFCDIIAPEKGGVIIIDLGTVGKILFLDENKKFHGASIFPDIQQFAMMTNSSTDLLNESLIDPNPPLVSLKTKECISSGAIHGMCALVSGLVKRINQEYHHQSPYSLYLTGGCSNMIKNHLKDYDIGEFIYDPTLCLKGVAKLMKESLKK